MSTTLNKLTKAKLLELLGQETERRIALESKLAQRDADVARLKQAPASSKPARRTVEQFSLADKARRYCAAHQVASCTKQQLLNWEG